MDPIKVGAGVLVWKDGQLLLGRRLSKHGHAQWAFPGGHVEVGESPEDAAAREVQEETSLEVVKLNKLHFTSNVFSNGQHYITLFFTATVWEGTVQNMEPEKCQEWKWFSPDALPEPLFEPVVSLLKEVALQAPSL